MILLALACVLLALWGAGSVVHLLGHPAFGGLRFAPQAAAALIFTGMLFGPARSHPSPDDEHQP